MGGRDDGTDSCGATELEGSQTGYTWVVVATTVMRPDGTARLIDFGLAARGFAPPAGPVEGRR